MTIAGPRRPAASDASSTNAGERDEQIQAARPARGWRSLIRPGAPDGAVAPESGVAACGLGLSTDRGWVYRDIDLVAPAGSVALITGPAGCGKTALLLTLAARMRPTAGALRVGGCDAVAHPQRARRLVGLGETAGVNDLDETLTVADQVRGELALHGRHALSGVRGAGGDRHETHGQRIAGAVAAVLAPVGLDLDPKVRVGDLPAAERLLLGVALACVGRPPVLAVDDLHEDLTPADHELVMARLRALADTGPTVVAGSLDPSLAAHADVTLQLDIDGCAALTSPEALHALA